MHWYARGDAADIDADRYCSLNVEFLYYDFSGRGVYDIRQAAQDAFPDVPTRISLLIIDEDIQEMAKLGGSSNGVGCAGELYLWIIWYVP